MKLNTLTSLLAVAAFTLASHADEPADKPEPPEDSPEVDFPAELTLPLDRIPQPAHRSILQRIDDHERLEQILTAPPPREIPIEVRPVEGGDQIRIRLR